MENWHQHVALKLHCSISIFFKNEIFLCPRYSKNGGGALSVTPVRVCVRVCMRLSVIKIWYVDI